MRFGTRLLLASAGIFALSLRTALCDDPAPAPPAAPQARGDSAAVIASSLKWQTGTITLKDGLAKLALTRDYRFLDHADSEKVLHDLWGNPEDPAVLGMIFPSNYGPLDHDGWAIAVEYDDSGYVKDDDAAKIDYPALLKQMQQQTLDQNAERQKEGYAPETLIGWAAPPHYDAATHKLYWAKEYHFGNDPDNTLNYHIRVLGRRGVLELNAIASMQQFPEVDGQTPKVLSMVDFEPGNMYANFDPKIDKIATYGLATLIAGGALGVAAKVGLLKGLWIGLLALKKLVVVAVVAVVAFFKKMAAKFSGRSSSSSRSGLPPQQRQ